MITKEIFNYGMELLACHFGKELDDRVKGIWFTYLDEELQSEEFLSSVKHSLLHSRFMPTAGELVEFIQGGKQSKALIEWQSVLKASARADESMIAYLSTRGKVALQALGGLRVVGAAEVKDRDRMERNFVTVYCQCSDRDAKSLPASSEEVSRQPQEHEAAPVPEHIKQQMEALKQKVGMNGAGRK